MIDKNNWCLDCNKLTDGRYKEVCTFLRVNNLVESDSIFGIHISRISLDLINKSQLANKPYYIGVVNGVCNIKFRRCLNDVFKGIPEITYHEFLEHILNKNNTNCSNVSDGYSRNMQIDIKDVFKHIVELCDACQITLSFNGNRVDVFSEIGEWYVDLNEEDVWDKLMKLVEAVKVLNEACKL